MTSPALLALAAALSLGIGAILGLLGGGGSILSLPMLVYVLGVEPRAAIATSLAVVSVTSAVGAAMHARSGALRVRVGLGFGLAAMGGAFVGGRVARWLPARVLLVVFALVMLVTASAMLRPRRPRGDAARPARMGHAAALGASVGALSGLVGAGGGFMVVPALSEFAGLTMREAIATSLLVIALQSAAGFFGQSGGAEIDFMVVGVVTGAAVIGALVGAALGRRVPTAALRSSFAWLVLAMGLFVIGKQLPWPATAVLAAIVLALALSFRRRAAPAPVEPSALPRSEEVTDERRRGA